MVPDLHCHSTRSDGTLSPTELAQRAHARQVALWSLTDHDDLGGLDEAARAAAALALPFVPGVEVSVTWGPETIHIVGLRIDPAASALRHGLAELRLGRTRRAEQMAAGLERAGHPGALDGARRHVRNPELVSRTHFARWLVDEGVCRDMPEVFQRFLVGGKPGHVPHRWATLDDAVGWIRDAGGVAVMAHPGRYKLNAIAFDALLDAFQAAGGRGIEVLTPSHDEAAVQRYADLARRRGLLASQGADFHDPAEARVDLGGLPALPRGLNPVWADWPEARGLSPSTAEAA